MQVIQQPEQLDSVHGGVLVPTMGALHEGHLALIRKAAKLCSGGQPVVVSIFVNPTQFAPGEDYQTYPRNLDHDVDLAGRAGADVVFAPDEAMVYPEGGDFREEFYGGLPPAATEPGLEDAHRPGHFHGVCQVVARLFDLVQPRTAVFGEKDYQQLIVIEQLVGRMGQQNPQRWGELHIAFSPTVREPDGLAMSSRNAYRDQAQRTRALALSSALFAARDAVGDAQTPGELEEIMHGVLADSAVDVDYAVVRDARTLQPIAELDAPMRALVESPHWIAGRG